jgi:hypothetical protein
MIKTDVELHPFRVPNYVIVKTEPKPRQDGYSEAPKYHLSELSESVLNELCEQFKKDVFIKAGR